MTAKKRILFLAANPASETALRLQEEAREIREELKFAGLRDDFSFEERGAVRPKDFWSGAIGNISQFCAFLWAWGAVRSDLS